MLRRITERYLRWRLLQEQPNIKLSSAERVEKGRFDWAVYEVVVEYYNSWEKFATDRGYAQAKVVYKVAADGTREKVSNIYFPEAQLYNIGNLDETEAPLDASCRGVRQYWPLISCQQPTKLYLV
jgi:hypothetical protein